MTSPRTRTFTLVAGLFVGVPALLLTGAGVAAPSTQEGLGAQATQTGTPDLIPRPVSYEASPDDEFELDKLSQIVVTGESGETRTVASRFARQLHRSTGFGLPVSTQPARDGDISLSTKGSESLGDEGYQLTVDDQVSIVAHTAEGVFRGLTTLRQLLPPKVEAQTRQPGPWVVEGAEITDEPRFPYRGTMLDVSRHFFSVDEVKRYIDLASLYKINTLHMHLADDQGWRIQVDSWPRLTTYGGSLEVGGTPGGSYTKRQFAEIVRYAADHYIEIVPEIDTPGHTNAALASYAELNCDGIAPPLYTGTDVGFSSLCIPKPITYEFLDDVFREVAEQSPGPRIHLGGDEAHVTPHEQYLEFVPKAAALVTKRGKTVQGWQEIAETPLPPGSTAQYWGTEDPRSDGLARMAVAQGAEVLMSPANHVYLDMKYDENTPYGLTWAGLIPVQKSYDWDPATLVDGVSEEDVVGVEAPLWSETLDEISKVEFMAFPRLPGVAEIGWTPAADRSWDEYKSRLGGQAPRWEVLDVNYFAAEEIPWQ